MTLGDKIQSIFYTFNSRHIPGVSPDEFVGILRNSLKSMLDVASIDAQAGNTLFAGENWTEELQRVHVEVCLRHLNDVWVRAHNALNFCKPNKRYKRVHQAAMLTSRCYGETLTAYIQSCAMLLEKDCFASNAWSRKRRDGSEWDKRTGEYSEKLSRELESISMNEPNRFGALLSDEGVFGLERSAVGCVLHSWE